MKDNNPALTFIKCRLPGGKFYENIKKDLSRTDSRRRFPIDMLKFLCGDHAAYFLFPKKSVDLYGEYTHDCYLYHITPRKNIASIKAKGLISRRKYTFLTDDADFILNGIFKDKYDNPAVLRIDAASLRKKHRLYYIERAHEIVTDAVEPEYIMFD